MHIEFPHKLKQTLAIIECKIELYKLIYKSILETAITNKTITENLDTNDVATAIAHYTSIWLRNQKGDLTDKLTYADLLHPIQTAHREATKTSPPGKIPPLFDLAERGLLAGTMHEALKSLHMQFKIAAKQGHPDALKVLRMLPPADFNQIYKAIQDRLDSLRNQETPQQVDSATNHQR